MLDAPISPATCADVPPVTTKKPILFSDLRYRVRKLILAEDEVEFPGIGSAVELYAQGELESMMKLPARGTDALRRERVAQICYQVEHKPTKLFSPIYDHRFTANAVARRTGGVFIGPMKLYPAENVWPELTRKGFYGELPQFYT